MFERLKLRAIEKKEQSWLFKKQLLERQEKIKDEKKSFKKSKKLSTSKLLIAFLFLNCTIIEIFTGWAIAKMLQISLINNSMIDFTPLVTLIGAVIGEVVGYAIYSLKATKENTQGGVVYDAAMKEFDNIINSNDAVG